MVLLDVYLLLACRAVEEVPSDTGRWPVSEHALFDALDMEDMLASENYRWLVTDTTDHADTAIVFVCVVLVELEVHKLLIVLLDALLVKAW